MVSNYLDKILDYIGDKNPMHYKKLKKNTYRNDAQYVERAETFFKNYEELLAKENKDLPYALDCYLQMCSDMMYEQIRFAETGAYTSTSFDEVNERVYGNPEIMGYYMHGLLVSQYLWEHHYNVLQFFFNNINKYSKGVKHVLEIGGGHGLYTNEIIQHFNFDFSYTMVDISQTSINMSKAFVKGNKVDYLLMDVYKYESDKKFDFIIMGEVLEHVENPLGLMKKLYTLAADNVTAFITAPCNSPTIDHIYLFKHPGEITALLNDAGWDVIQDIVASSETKKSIAVDDPLIPVMYAAFVKKHEFGPQDRLSR